ncbi:MAG: hypothetical protein ACLFTU_03945, partial [Puniceicoccaceae bacterium]
AFPELEARSSISIFGLHSHGPSFADPQEDTSQISTEKRLFFMRGDNHISTWAYIGPVWEGQLFFDRGGFVACD